MRIEDAKPGVKVKIYGLGPAWYMSERKGHAIQTPLGEPFYTIDGYPDEDGDVRIVGEMDAVRVGYRRAEQVNVLCLDVVEDEQEMSCRGSDGLIMRRGDYVWNEGGDRGRITDIQVAGGQFVIDVVCSIEDMYVDGYNGTRKIHASPANRWCIDKERQPAPKPHTENAFATPPLRYSCGHLAMVGDVVTDGHFPSTNRTSVVQNIDYKKRDIECDDGDDTFEVVAKQYRLVRRAKDPEPAKPRSHYASGEEPRKEDIVRHALLPPGNARMMRVTKVRDDCLIDVEGEDSLTPEGVMFSAAFNWILVRRAEEQTQTEPTHNTCPPILVGSEVISKRHGGPLLVTSINHDNRCVNLSNRDGSSSISGVPFDDVELVSVKSAAQLQAQLPEEPAPRKEPDIYTHIYTGQRLTASASPQAPRLVLEPGSPVALVQQAWPRPNAKFVSVKDVHGIGWWVEREHVIPREDVEPGPRERLAHHASCGTHGDDVGVTRAYPDAAQWPGSLAVQDEYDAGPRVWTINKTRREQADAERWRPDDYTLNREPVRDRCKVPGCGLQACMHPRPRTSRGTK